MVFNINFMVCISKEGKTRLIIDSGKDNSKTEKSLFLVD